LLFGAQTRSTKRSPYFDALRHVLPAGMACAMNRRSSAAGGIFLFLGLIVGTVYGINVGEPMLWLLRGFAAGAALAVLVWFIDRRRS
jgi:hypothetical protein